MKNYVWLLNGEEICSESWDCEDDFDPCASASMLYREYKQDPICVDTSTGEIVFWWAKWW